MELNIIKCSSISFYRIRSPVLFEYQLAGQTLNRCTSIRDLGVILSQDYNAAAHVNNICARAFKILGLLARVSRHMNNPLTLRTFYCAYGRPILEYGSVVWSPHQSTLNTEIQRVQRKFIRYVGLRLGFDYRTVPISDLEADLRLPSLENRRKTQDVLFLHRLINGLIDSPELLLHINLRASGRTRSADLFERRHHSTNYEANSTMERIQRLGNEISHLDFFCGSLSRFRAGVLRQWGEQRVHE